MNRRRIVYIIIILVIIITLVCIGLKVYKYFRKPINVKLIEISRITTDENWENGGYWSVIYDNEHPVIERYNMKLPEIDYDKNYLVFSAGRELKQLYYKKGDTLPYGKDVYKGYTVFGKILYPNTIFIYKIEKIKIAEDEFSAPEDIIIEE